MPSYENKAETAAFEASKRRPTKREPINLDPNYDWIEATAFGDPGPIYIQGQCRHLEVVPVETVDGELVAQLCVICDTQLPVGERAYL